MTYSDRDGYDALTDELAVMSDPPHGRPSGFATVDAFIAATQALTTSTTVAATPSPVGCDPPTGPPSRPLVGHSGQSPAAVPSSRAAGGTGDL